MEKESALNLLIRRELGAVTFVRDYLQLHFDGPLLNTYVWPVIRTSGTSYSFEMQGYRDELCARIGCVVMAVTEGECIAIEFGDGSVVEISLRLEDRVGPEAVLLDDGRGKVWSVW